MDIMASEWMRGPSRQQMRELLLVLLLVLPLPLEEEAVEVVVEVEDVDGGP